MSHFENFKEKFNSFTGKNDVIVYITNAFLNIHTLPYLIMLLYWYYSVLTILELIN